MTRAQVLNLLLLFSVLVMVFLLRVDDAHERDQNLIPAVVREQLSNVRSVHVGGVDIVHQDGGWKVMSSGGYPADGAVVNRLLRGLDEARRREMKTNRAEGLLRLGLGENDQTQLRLKDAEGKVLYMLHVGHQEPRVDYGGFRTFVAQGGRAWAIAHLPKISANPTDWMDPLLWRMNTSRIHGLDVKDKGKRLFQFAYDDKSQGFKLKKSKKPLNEKAEYLIGAPSFIALRGVDLSDGSALELRRTLTWRTWDGLEVVVRIKADANEGLWAFFEAREGQVMADKVEGVEETAMDEVARLNARWRGFAFRLDDEKMGDLMVPKADVTAAK